MDARRAPTIIDVAKRAGVSKSLVSIVFRGGRYVSAERREAVLAAAKALGYRPNAMASTLAAKRSRVIGVLASDLHNPFFPEVTYGIQEAAKAIGCRALLGSGNRRSLDERDVVDAMLELRVYGLVLLSPNLSVPALRDVASATHLVVVGRRPSGLAGVDTVSSDDRRGAHLAVEHLVANGHERIAHLAGGRRSGAIARRRGYEEAMGAAGLADRIRVASGDYTTESGGYEGALRLLTGSPRPTALFTVNDLAAAGACSAAEELGLAIPADLSVVGYDNTSLAAMRQLSLTTVNQPRFEMGQRAVEVLEARVTGERGSRGEHVVLEPTLVERQSVAVPPD